MILEKFLINDEIVVITGGAGLLGQKHAEAIAEIGGTPIIVDIDEQRATEAADAVRQAYQCDCGAYGADITDENALRQVLAELESRFGKTPYGLINNAAIDPKFDQEANKVPKSRLEAFPLEQWNKELSVGLTGAFLCAKVFGPEMAKRGKGTIINISSDLGIISPDQRLYRKEGASDDIQPVKPVTYSVIKHGIIGLTKYLATYWAASGVRCNALAPGGVYNNHPAEFVEKISELIPVGRMADKDEYKSAIQFLVSDASSYMTGATLVMDGGRSVW
jgi:NAD(P)-dependent dehydrogenase (short-subunit alcohol dehydrogenase family)